LGPLVNLEEVEAPLVKFTFCLVEVVFDTDDVEKGNERGPFIVFVPEEGLSSSFLSLIFK
jgi:hypothetical protein